jgi:hypothetical protein
MYSTMFDANFRIIHKFKLHKNPIQKVEEFLSYQIFTIS